MSPCRPPCLKTTGQGVYKSRGASNHAARIAAESYRRERDLGRVLKTGRTADPGTRLESLLEIEAEIEESRKGGTAAYNVTRHVEVLTAMIAEAGLMRTARP